MSLDNAGPPDRVSVLSTECGGCHPNGLIDASSHKIKQIIILKFIYAIKQMILKFIYAEANPLFC